MAIGSTASVTTVDPAIETASNEGRTLAPGFDTPLPPTRRTKLPFAAQTQGLLIVVMLVGFALIAQQWSKLLYQIGLPILVVAAFLQIAFGNIPPTAGRKRSLILLGVTWLIVAAIFGLAVAIAPTLIDLGR